MPSEAFIEYNDKGFWIPESFVEVLSEYLCETFENIGVSSLSKNLQEIYIDCDRNRRGWRVGMVDISLDEIITEEDKINLIKLLDQSKALINSNGSELSIETLEDFESRKVDEYFKDIWAFPIKTKSLTATIDIIIQMLKGTWNSNNYSVYYKGFPNPMNREEI